MAKRGMPRSQRAAISKGVKRYWNDVKAIQRKRDGGTLHGARREYRRIVNKLGVERGKTSRSALIKRVTPLRHAVSPPKKEAIQPLPPPVSPPEVDEERAAIQAEAAEVDEERAAIQAEAAEAAENAEVSGAAVLWEAPPGDELPPFRLGEEQFMEPMQAAFDRVTGGAPRQLVVTLKVHDFREVGAGKTFADTITIEFIPGADLMDIMRDFWHIMEDGYFGEDYDDHVGVFVASVAVF
jgi:hypothetical protein